MTIGELKQALARLPANMDRHAVVIAMGAEGHNIHCGPVCQIVVAQPGLVLFPFPYPPPPDGAVGGPPPEDPADWWKKV